MAQINPSLPTPGGDIDSWGSELNSALNQMITQGNASDAGLGTKITAPVDPNADRILFWDDSAGTWTLLAPTAPLAITGTSIAVADASLTAKGVVELATPAEATAGTDASRAVTPAGLADRVKGAGVLDIVALTQAAYDALGTKVATTLYVIVGG